MTFEAGERLSFAFTGTVIGDTDFLKALSDIYGSEMDTSVLNGINDRQYVNLKLDNGIVTRVDITDDNDGFKVNRANPLHWPPVQDDVWRDADDASWYAGTIDLGNRSGLRMRKYTALGEIIRSTGQFLKENPAAYLYIRDGVFFE